MFYVLCSMFYVLCSVFCVDLHRQRDHRLRGVPGHDGAAAKGGPGGEERGGTLRDLPHL